MSKRILSLLLALSMVLLALPALTLTSLENGAAQDVGPTVNFRIGATYDEKTLTTAHGAIVSTATLKEQSLPNDHLLAEHGLTADDILTWAYWDATTKKYINLEEMVLGLAAVPEADVIDVYPIYKSAGYRDGLPIVSGTDDDNDPATPDKLTLEAYRSGWTFTTPHKTSGMLVMVVEQGTKPKRQWYRGYLQAWANDRAPLCGAVLQNGDILLGHNSAGYQESATGLSYQAMFGGKVKINLPKADNIQLLVCVDGVCVLGAEEHIGQPNPSLNTAKDAETGVSPSNADWFTFGSSTDEGWDDVADASLTVSVEKGEMIDIIVKRSYPADATVPKDTPARDDQWLKNWNPTISYEEVYPTPTVAAAPSLGSTLAVDFVAILPDGYEFDSGVLINGEEADSISLAPADADEEFTVQPFYNVDASTRILGEEKTYTFNGLMTLYEGSDYEALAKAALNYTAAFEAFFGEGDIPTVPSFTGTYNDIMGAVDYKGNDEVTIVGASLIVGEKIGIKLVVRDLPAGATLEIAGDKAFTRVLHAEQLTMTATSDNTGHKYIMDGISITSFDTIYYFRVVDAEGNVISDTIGYSVSTYCTRMASSTDLKLRTLVNAMMGLYEAGISTN